MSTVDEILASGHYTDRRGRRWIKAVLSGRWESPLRIDPGKGQTYLSLSRESMRLLIERDQHRGVCPGLRGCRDHPVPIVIVRHRAFWIFAAHNNVARSARLSITKAIKAARALAVTS